MRLIKNYNSILGPFLLGVLLFGSYPARAELTAQRFLTAISDEQDGSFESRKIVRWDTDEVRVQLIVEDTPEGKEAEESIRAWLDDLNTELSERGVPTLKISPRGTKQGREHLYIIVGSKQFVVFTAFHASTFLPFNGFMEKLQGQHRVGLPLCSAALVSRNSGHLGLVLVTISLGELFQQCLSEEITHALGLRGEFNDQGLQSALNAANASNDLTEFDFELLQHYYSDQFQTGEKPSLEKIRSVLEGD